MDATKRHKIEKILKPDRPFTTQNNAFCFLTGNRIPINSAGNGVLAAIQEFLKRFGYFYYMMIRLFSPVMPSAAYKKQFNDLLANYDPTSIIINLGSGPSIIGRRGDIINIDIFAFNEVDMIADASDLPLKDNTADLIFNTAMLEHVAVPEKIINEIHRILKPGGKFFCYLPFMVPFHAAPHDFHRWTIEGTRHCFEMFEQIDVSIGAGPTSGMLWVIQEWLAIVLSFGSRTLHDIIFLLLMPLTAPIKLLDIIFIHFPHAEKIASGFFVTGKK